MVKGQKGYLGITLRGEGVAAHSAYPGTPRPHSEICTRSTHFRSFLTTHTGTTAERGRSAIEPLLDVLQDLRADVETWPHHPVRPLSLSFIIICYLLLFIRC